MLRYNKIKKGFTLIELLIVIAILAILISILVPALRSARAHAKFVMCKTNLTSYGKMAFLYIADNKDYFPNPWTSFYTQRTYTGEPHRYCRWHNPDFDLNIYPQYAGPFWKYLKGKNVHLCPTFAGEIAQQYGPRHPEHIPTVPIKPNYTYSMNAFLYEKKISNVKYLEGIFFFAEENLWKTTNYNGIQFNNYAFNDTAFWCIPGPDGSTTFCYGNGDSFGTFHMAPDPDLEEGVANAVFLDGHVQTVRRIDTWRFAAPDGYLYEPTGLHEIGD